MSIKKLLLVGLLALPISAEAAITLVGCSEDDVANATSLTVGEPSGTVQNDVVVGWAVRGDNIDDGDWVDPADWTQGDLQDETLGNADGQLYWGYKVRGAAAGNALTWDFGSGSTLAGMSLVVCAFRGVDTSNPIDVTYADGSHYNSNNNSVNTAAQPITTVTNDAWVLIAQVFTQEVDAVCGGEPSGYTLRQTIGTLCTSPNSRHLTVYSKEKATAGVETPGAFAHTDTDTNADGRNYTIALRPASTVPTFTVGPSEAPAADGFTISGTITCTGTCTVEAVAYSPALAAPNCTQIKAGQNINSVAALMNNQDNWATGVSDSFLLTSANKPVRFNVAVCGTDGTTDTAVTTFTNQDRSIRSGYAHSIMASHDPLGLCNEDAQFTPDCADGDGFEYKIDTEETAACDAAISTTGLVTLTPTAPGDCGGVGIRRTFKQSAQDSSNTTTMLFTAPSAANFTTDDLVYVNNVGPDCDPDPEDDKVLLIKDEVMQAQDLTALGGCSDLEGDALSYSITGGSLPTGTALSGTGNKDWTGTPTVKNEAGTLITVTAADVVSYTTTYQFTVYVSDNAITTPNVVNDTVATATSDMAAVRPWLDDDQQLAPVYEYHESVAVGRVIRQTPASSQPITASAPLVVIVSLGSLVIDTLAEEILEDEPTAYWKVDETAGTTITDYSGNGHTLTLAGTYSLGRSKLVPTRPTARYLYINGGTGNYAGRAGTLGLTMPLNGDWTAEAIVSVADFLSAIRVMFSIMASGETEATNYQILHGFSSVGAPQILWEHSAGTNITVSAIVGPMTPINVYHVVAVKDGDANVIKWYLNGVSWGTVSYATEPTGGSSANVRLGGDESSLSIIGSIGEVAFYGGVELSAERIAIHAAAAGLLGR